MVGKTFVGTFDMTNDVTLERISCGECLTLFFL